MHNVYCTYYQLQLVVVVFSALAVLVVVQTLNPSTALALTAMSRHPCRPQPRGRPATTRDGRLGFEALRISTWTPKMSLPITLLFGACFSEFTDWLFWVQSFTFWDWEGNREWHGMSRMALAYLEGPSLRSRPTGSYS